MRLDRLEIEANGTPSVWGGVAILPGRARCQRLKATLTEATKLLDEQAWFESQGMGRSVYRRLFVTLTYATGERWDRRHVSEYLHCVRQWLHRQGYHRLMYAWVMELTQGGRPHYHLIMWVPRALRMPAPDKAGWWSHGSSNVQTARNPVGYMTKYATKTTPHDLKRLPKRARIHGNGGLTPFNRVRKNERLLPWWMRKELKHQDGLRREALVVDAEAERAWLARRQAIYDRHDDGTVWVTYRDLGHVMSASERLAMLVQAEEEAQAAEALYIPYATKYGPKGLPRVERVSGGFVDLLTGALYETPYEVKMEHGLVMVYPKLRTLQ